LSTENATDVEFMRDAEEVVNSSLNYLKGKG